ncbi:MAG: polysaccharide deacetylase family protein [Victivallaceae bacterium]|nr:polysaccharide deacetylase family protein [Victivallaceae bacterium]
MTGMRSVVAAAAVSACMASYAATYDNFRYAFPEWKLKAVTMAYDDALEPDRKLVEIFNRHGIKGTFYLSANRVDEKYKYKGTPGELHFMKTSECAALYAGHEIGSHGLNHVNMSKLSESEMEKEIADDIATIEGITGRPVRSFAYPYGAYDARVQSALRRHGVVCARTTGDSGRFSLKQDPLAWHATCHHNNRLMERAGKFVAYRGFAGVLAVMSVWGHSYELARQGNWDDMEDFCRLMEENSKQVWFATNGDLFEYLDACKRIQSTMDGKVLVNPTATTVYALVDHIKDDKFAGTEKITIPPRSAAVLEPATGVVYPQGTYPVFPGGLKKALTFSYDDGSYADDALVKVFNEYGVKGTFNVNSKRRKDFSIYLGHEVATHGFNHLTYSLVPKSVALDDLVRDRAYLERCVGYPVRGHAYPNGDGHCYSKELVELLRGIDICYARGTVIRDDFSMPDDWYNWIGSGRNTQADFVELADKFLASDRVPALCYIWGHSTELAKKKDMDRMRSFLGKVAGRTDIWYATNIDIYDYMEAVRRLRWAQDKSFVNNPSALTVYYVVNGKLVVIGPGETVAL